MQNSISYEKLKSFCIDLLTKENVPLDEATVISTVILEANLRGVDSHGISRLPSYLMRLREGGSKRKAQVEVLRDFPAGATWDCQGSMGQVTAFRAMNAAIEKAKTVGIASVALKGNNHTGANAFYVQKAAENNMIGLVVGNGPPMVAPFASASAFFSTNPLSFGVPARKHKPIIIDMATSVSARGKIILANKNNQEIPLGWATDAQGNDTTNPAEALKGVLLPFGGHKGYSIALMVEILAGLLSGAGYGPSMNEHVNKHDVPVNAGNLFIAINISMFTDLDEFLNNVDESIDIIHNGKVRPGFDKILVPGEIELQNKERCLAEGIVLPEAIYKELDEAASYYSLSLTNYIN